MHGLAQRLTRRRLGIPDSLGWLRSHANRGPGIHGLDGKTPFAECGIRGFHDVEAKRAWRTHKWFPTRIAGSGPAP
jgi:hypothetical protein